jgi:hypothetical protein
LNSSLFQNEFEAANATIAAIPACPIATMIRTDTRRRAASKGPGKLVA